MGQTRAEGKAQLQQIPNPRHEITLINAERAFPHLIC